MDDKNNDIEKNVTVVVVLCTDLPRPEKITVINKYLCKTYQTYQHKRRNLLQREFYS